MVKVKVTHAYINIDDSADMTATILRGFLGYLFIEDTEFHHHSDNSFHYPLVQYKKVNGRLLVMGFSDYADVIFGKMTRLETILTSNDKIKVSSVDLVTISFDILEKHTKYRFVTPWIALNQKNYEEYRNLKSLAKKEFLEKILIGNLLSALKGLNIFVDFKINAKIKNVRQIMTTVHGNKFASFRAEFEANIALPEFTGIGKSVSKGFGVLERLS